MACLFVLSVGAASAAAEVTTYSATEKFPVPPASDFHGEGGGDGWAVALSEKEVFNVFHHNSEVQVACHLQENATDCWSPRTITETGTGDEFATSGQPGLYLDHNTGKLYVYATRYGSGPETAGVVCIDTEEGATNTDPFCGFTALSGEGEGARPGSDSGVSDPMLIGSHWYSFNYVNGAGQEGTKNKLMCFDVSTASACAGQPYAVPIGSGNVSNGGFPSPATAAIDGKAIIPVNVDGSEMLACFDDATQANCAGQWPVKLSFSYAADYGAPYPLMDATGTMIGLCLPTGTDQCFNLEGEEVETPKNMSSVVRASAGWNGPALVLGPRAYVPNFYTNEVECFDYSTGETCNGFPKHLTGLNDFYTVNPDPQRPTCIWINSDDGEYQIQNFDAYSGGACGEGTIRVLASQFVVPQPQCTPASYVSLQVLKPEPTAYTTGTVGFDDGDGNSIPGLPSITLDATGTASLAGLQLNTPTGLPQFLFTLEGTTGTIGNVEVKLTWQGEYDATCAEGERAAAPPEAKPEAKKEEPKTTTTTPPVPAPKVEVASFGAAHLASSAPACVASNGYVASVRGNLIESVTFTLGGHKVATVRKPNSHGVYATRIKLPVGSKEKLAIKVVFTSASKTHTDTITKNLARCAVVHHIATPRFTG